LSTGGFAAIEERPLTQLEILPNKPSSATITSQVGGPVRFKENEPDKVFNDPVLKRHGLNILPFRFSVVRANMAGRIRFVPWQPGVPR
jgi:hypothetical protein